MANPVLERRYSDWLSDRSIKSGLEPVRIALSVVFVLIVFAVSVVHFAFPGAVAWLTDFPTDPNIRLTAISWVEAFFDFIIASGQWFFDIITFGIRSVLDGLEVLFVDTPWPVIAAMIILLTWLSAGAGAAFAAAGFLAYMGFLGFWEKAMTTLALLGTAACISIALGIPIGMFCARRPRFYAVIRPIMDFMQTMPAFVFMIPVIAFFGTGKPAAVVTTMIFGGTPVVRLTVLGLRGVPESIREAAIAYGASKMVPADQGRPSPGSAFDPCGCQPDDHAVAGHGSGRLADRCKRTGRGCAGSVAIRVGRAGNSGRVCNPVLRDDPGPCGTGKTRIAIEDVAAGQARSLLSGTATCRNREAFRRE